MQTMPTRTPCESARDALDANMACNAGQTSFQAAIDNNNQVAEGVINAVCDQTCINLVKAVADQCDGDEVSYIKCVACGLPIIHIIDIAF